MKIDVKVNIDAEKILKQYGLGQSKEAQRALGQIVERKCQPYVPRNTGTLSNRATVTDDAIIYHGPYAHYQYVGEVMGPNYVDDEGNFWSGDAPKYYTGKELQYQGSPKRGKQWDKRMMADHGDEVVQDFEVYLKNRNK